MATQYRLFVRDSASSGDGGTLPMLGCYSEAWGDDHTLSSFGGYPDLASTYYQGNQTISQANEQARVDNGIDPVITMTVRNGGPSWADIATGTQDAWLDAYINDLSTLQAYAASKGRQVWATFDHEAEVKINQGTVVGTITDYAAAYNRWQSRLRTLDPTVKTLYWYGYSDTTKINQIGSTIDPPDIISLDPYDTASRGIETFTDMAGPKLSWLRSQSWYKGQPIAFTEFGIDKSHGDTACAAFHTNIREYCRDLGIAWAIFFNRDTDGNYAIDVGTTPLAQAAFSASLAEGR